MKERFMNKKGFTLIELLVVVAVIGILVSLGTARYLTAEKSTRDLRRKSDLSQYRTALENYANANNSVYPGSAANGTIDVLCRTGSFATQYLSGSCIEDVMKNVAGHSNYFYYANAGGTDYVLWAQLERTEGGAAVYYEVCSNGRSGEVENQPTDANCDL